MKKSDNPFEIEKQRAELAKKKEYKKLAETYSPAYAEIPDANTSQLWDELNITGRNPVAKNPMEDTRLKYVSSLIKKEKFSLLNIGFGSANLEVLFFDKQKNLHSNISWKGIDISDKSVKEAKKKFPRCKFEIGNILKIKEKDNSFDYIIALEVLEHIKPSRIFSALKEIYRVLKPGGYFILAVPLNEGLEKMIANGENPNAHVRIYTPELIVAELEIINLKILKQKTLFAFPNYYSIKSFIARYLLKNKFRENDIIILSQKP